jgi:hypothetical protein
MLAHGRGEQGAELGADVGGWKGTWSARNAATPTAITTARPAPIAPYRMSRARDTSNMMINRSVETEAEAVLRFWVPDARAHDIRFVL